jgi:hypothetical protein
MASVSSAPKPILANKVILLIAIAGLAFTQSDPLPKECSYPQNEWLLVRAHPNSRDLGVLAMGTWADWQKGVYFYPFTFHADYISGLGMIVTISGVDDGDVKSAEELFAPIAAFCIWKSTSWTAGTSYKQSEYYFGVRKFLTQETTR